MTTTLMKPVTLTAIFIVLLTGCLFFILWLIDYSASGIPDKVPGTNYDTYGITMLLVTIITLLIFQKLILKYNSSAGVLQLAGPGALVAIVAQLIYQTVRQVWILRFESNDKTTDLIISMAALSVLLTSLSVFLALELKKANPLLKVASIAVCATIIWLMKENLGRITW